jgi:hypothetical protein
VLPSWLVSSWLVSSWLVLQPASVFTGIMEQTVEGQRVSQTHVLAGQQLLQSLVSTE